MTTIEIDKALRIDEDPRLAPGEKRVALGRRIDLHRIRHPGTTALFNKKPQALLGGRKVFILEQVEEVLRSGFGYFDHLWWGEFVPTIPPGTRCPKSFPSCF